jgi:transcriptional regulator with GAF, ATPase, and Fis domain
MKLIDIERRHWELWAIALVIILFFAVTIIHLALFTDNKSIFLAFLAVFSVLFCFYIVEREKKLLGLSRQLSQEELQVLEEQSKVSLLNTRLKELSALHRAGEAVHLEKLPQRSLDIILQSAMELFEATRGSIMLLDEQREHFVIASAQGLHLNWMKKTQKATESVAGWVLQTGEPLLLSGKVKDNRFTNFVEKETHIKSAMCAPLRLYEKVIGVLNCTVVGENKKTFTEYDLKLLSVFAQYAAIAIENAQLQLTLKQSKPHPSLS